MTRDPERDLRFVVGMIAVPCVICGLAALLGVPAAGGLFFGMAGTLLGIGAARALLPRRDRGLTVRPILALAAGGSSPATASQSSISPRGGGCSCGA